MRFKDWTMRFKVYFSLSQLQARDANTRGVGEHKEPIFFARLTTGVVVPYTQLVDIKDGHNYKPIWEDSICLGIAYREDVVGCDADESYDPILNIDELEPMEEIVSCS